MGKEQKGSLPSTSIKAQDRGVNNLPPFFITTADDLSTYLDLDQRSKAEIERVSLRLPFKIPLHYLSIMDKTNPSCPIKRQAVPSIDELKKTGVADPLNEDGFSITPSFIKKYPKRGVLLASSECAMYCRFCNRKRFIGKTWNPWASIEESLRYIEKDVEIKEVIISGGDPFMLSPDRLNYLLVRLSHIKRVKVLRLSTRLPVVSPEALTDGHIEAIKGIFPLWLIIHINHPREITEGFMEGAKRLRQVNTILISQTVLLRGVNDCPHILLRLFEDLVALGIKPYYLFQLDEVMGAGHFKVKLKRGIEIMRYLRRYASGLAVPYYMVDITGGAGKVPIDYRYIKGKKGDILKLKGLLKDEGIYKDDGKDSLCLKCGLCKEETLE